MQPPVITKPRTKISDSATASECQLIDNNIELKPKYFDKIFLNISILTKAAGVMLVKQ